MEEITNITIQNVKGFMDTDNSFDVHILPNKVNLLIAPNGFGKSSIAKGFESLNGSRLNLPNDYYHDKSSSVIPELRITYDDKVLVANATKNEISSYFDVTVINSGLKATSTIKHFEQRIIHQGRLTVEDIILKNSIPKPERIDYSFTKIKKSFGENGKLLTNMKGIFETIGIACRIHELYDLLDILAKGDAKQKISSILANLNALPGSAEKNLENLDEHLFDDLEAIAEYSSFLYKTQDLRYNETRFARFDFFYQIMWLYKRCRSNLLNTRRYEKYILLRDRYNSIIKSVDTTGRNLQAHEEGGKLIITFPFADTMSNGQRDILTFIINLVKFEMNYKEGKKHLLIIDEVFDYLDDANVIAAQYFLSKFLLEEKGKIFMVILSHLSEEYFRGWVLKKKINSQYIKPIQAKVNISTKAFIAHRGEIKKKDPENYSKLSNYYFHYHPDAKYQDLSAAYEHKQNLKTDWFKEVNFHTYVVTELNKYLSASNRYDPYAVCFALRFGCEKNIYKQLESEEDKKIFLEEVCSTRDKLNWAEGQGLNVPVVYYMLSIIFNDAEHISGDEIQKKQERSCVYKLDNGAIRQMAIDLFDYQGTELDVNVLL